MLANRKDAKDFECENILRRKKIEDFLQLLNVNMQFQILSLIKSLRLKIRNILRKIASLR